MAVARDLAGGNNNVVAVIGDGSMSAGMGLRSHEQRRGAEIPPRRDPER